MLELDPTDPQGIQIYYIRRQLESVDLREQIYSGLSSTPLQMPSLLLWNDEGQRLFEKLSQTPDYYLNEKEMEILNHKANEIVGSIPPGSVLIELGCGNLQKTAIILSAFKRQNRAVSYYALDVSISEMTSSLKNLSKRVGKTTSVKIQGLLGTYDDCVTWLATSPNLGRPKSVNFLWVGNSIANFNRSEASSLLSRFSRGCKKLGVSCQFLVGADACNEEAKIMAAYDTAKEPLSSFILNGLRHANTIIGQEIFHANDWSCVSDFSRLEHVLHVSYTPRRDLRLEINGRSVRIRKGKKISAITSGKWTEEDMAKISADAGLDVSNTWKDESRTYCFYKLRPRA